MSKPNLSLGVLSNNFPFVLTLRNGLSLTETFGGFSLGLFSNQILQERIQCIRQGTLCFKSFSFSSITATSSSPKTLRNRTMRKKCWNQEDNNCLTDEAKVQGKATGLGALFPEDSFDGVCQKNQATEFE